MRHVFETVLLPRDDTAPQACEDRVVVLPPGFAAVIDGATSLDGSRWDGATGGALAADAIAAAFTDAWRASLRGEPDLFAEATGALALADHAIAALYDRLGLTDAARRNPKQRFRAAFAVASLRGGLWRLVGAGDCAARAGDGPVMTRDHPAEPVFAAWRAALLAEAPEADERWVRRVLSGGLRGPDGADPRVLRAATRARAAADPALADRALAAGLSGMRAAPPGDPLAFGVADGIGDMGADFLWAATAPEAQTDRIALWTDGWQAPGQGDAADWLRAAAEAHAADPRRIGRHRSVKGPTASGRHDDAGLVLIRRSDR